MNLDDALQTFHAECRHLLVEMEDALMLLEQELDDQLAIHSVFRAVHTIKGSAGLFGLDPIVHFTHKLENLLVQVRDASLKVDSQLVCLLLKCTDHIGTLLCGPDPSEDHDTAQAARASQGQQLAQALDERLYRLDAPPSLLTGCASPDPEPIRAAASPLDDPDVWHLSLRLSHDLFREGFDPASFIHHLQVIGRIVHITTITRALPGLEALDAESCLLGFEIRLAGAPSKAEIEQVFDFIRHDCTLRILPPDSKAQDYIQLIEALPEDRMLLGEMLVKCGAITERELNASLTVQHEQANAPLGEVLLKEGVIQPQVVQAALDKQQHSKRASADNQLIRIHADKLDALINRVGELVIASATVGVSAKRNKDRALREAVSQMSRLTEDVRESAMRLRMVDIGETFTRFRRVVRDVSMELGKDIELMITGGETELDKSVVDRIGDPLTHLVRNAIDHGIEPADVRRAQGKPERGRLALNARHEAGTIVIEIADDGGGLRTDAILAKARAQGMVAEDAQLADRDIWQLIFAPGFSTASHVTQLSGRGVGMDVVRSSIEALRGSVEIDSRTGQGTTFRIRLPLTLAIINGFLMSVGDGHYVVPLDVITECVKLDSQATEPPDRGYLDMRGEALPLLRLRQHFDLDLPSCRRENVVVVQVGKRKAGLVVDALKGEFQAVIKPLGPFMKGLDGISGSTILGTGEVALVLDVPALLNQAALKQHQLKAHA